MQIIKNQHDKDHTSYTHFHQMQNKKALITKTDTRIEINYPLDHTRSDLSEQMCFAPFTFLIFF